MLPKKSVKSVGVTSRDGIDGAIAHLTTRPMYAVQSATISSDQSSDGKLSQINNIDLFSSNRTVL